MLFASSLPSILVWPDWQHSAPSLRVTTTVCLNTVDTPLAESVAVHCTTVVPMGNCAFLVVASTVTVLAIDMPLASMIRPVRVPWSVLTVRVCSAGAGKHRSKFIVEGAVITGETRTGKGGPKPPMRQSVVLEPGGTWMVTL